MLNIPTNLLSGQGVKRFSKRGLYSLAMNKNISCTVYTVPVWNLQEFLYIPHQYSIDCTGHNVQSVLTVRLVLSELTVLFVRICTGTFCALQRFKVLQCTEIGTICCCCREIHFFPAAAVETLQQEQHNNNNNQSICISYRVLSSPP